MKITQKKAVFYTLLSQYRENPNEYLPAWRFVGEIYIPELDEHFLMSYKCPANGVDLYFDNPDLIERRRTTGKSGAKYYEYRLISPFKEENILDKIILDFYLELVTPKEERKHITI